MSSEDRRVLAVVGFAALLCGPLRAQTESAPPLGNAASFAVLGGSAVNNSGATVVTGNLGVSPGSTITGFPPGVVKLGDTFKNDALAKAAHHDMGVAYDDLANQKCGVPLSDSPPANHVYCLSQLPKVLTLDAEHKPDAFWIFQITGSLTTLPDSSVLAINGAQPGNVFWQVSGSASLVAGSAFVGNLIAHDSITLNTGATAFGRLLALTGTVTLDSNKVTLCSTCNEITLSPLVPSDGMLGTHFGQTLTADGGTAPYTFKVISGALPPGIDPLTSNGVLSGAPKESGKFQFTVAATDSQGCSGEREYTIFIPCALTLSPTTLPDAKACIFYTQTISAMGGSGRYKYTASGLPIGLTLSPTTETRFVNLSGILRRPDDYTFTVTAEDTVTHCIVSRTYTLKVLCNVMVLPETLPPATCSSYCQTFTASCGTPPYTFSFSAGTPPAGLLLSSDGMFCGTPTTPGRHTFTVTATDAKGCTGSRTYTVAVDSGPITISPPTLPNGIVGTIYADQTIIANCGTPGYRCRVSAGMLPPGLTLTNCKISGTPTTAGCFTFSLTVTDANGNSNSIRYTICVCAIMISPPELPVGSVCAKYQQQQLTASCGIPPYTFTVPPGTLPSGLMLSMSGLLSGTPMMIGPTTFTVTAKDSAQNTGNITYTLLTGGITLSPATLPAAELGIPYSKIITASGGTAPYTFSTSGTLPTGLTFTPTTQPTGTISGTPTALGTFNFCIMVSDANASPLCTATQCYTIDVIPAVAGGPTLSAWGMLLLLILLAGAGLVMIRRGD
ncbi:MAG: hypothetical protein QOC81_437 [Thermoanaerobaculia bacterium]|jgi:hypothetical protein|nr:hypothetical protein [Thermoanaerobaculia bacterium]